jgi:hypothetical protein
MKVFCQRWHNRLVFSDCRGKNEFKWETLEGEELLGGDHFPSWAWPRQFSSFLIVRQGLNELWAEVITLKSLNCELHVPYTPLWGLGMGSSKLNEHQNHLDCLGNMYFYVEIVSYVYKLPDRKENMAAWGREAIIQTLAFKTGKTCVYLKAQWKELVEKKIM